MVEFLGKIAPQFEKEEFLRRVWISLAREDVPFDVFEADCTEVKEVYHRVLVVNTSYRTTWTAEIGMNRQESYVDFETYTEKIPYTAFESKYNSVTKQNEQVPVTKYREEKRQRQVTKVRTVIDWHSGNGQHTGKEQFFDCVDSTGGFDKSRFFTDYDSKLVSPLTAEELANHPDMAISKSMLDVAYKSQSEGIYAATQRSIAGDHVRGVECNVAEFNPTSANLILVPEYVTTFQYKGRTYVQKAFPIGNMTVSKSGIGNPLSASSEREKLQSKTWKENRERNDQFHAKVWDDTKYLALASIGALALSVIFSIAVKVLFLVITCFLVAVGATVFAMYTTKKALKRIRKEIDEANAAANAACKEAVSNYEKHHKAELLDVLNKKLVSLGFSSVTNI